MIKGIQNKAHVYGPKTVFHVIFNDDNASIFFAGGRRKFSLSHVLIVVSGCVTNHVSAPKLLSLINFNMSNGYKKGLYSPI